MRCDYCGKQTKHLVRVKARWTKWHKKLLCKECNSTMKSTWWLVTILLTLLGLSVLIMLCVLYMVYLWT